MGSTLQVADLLFRIRGILEHGRSRPVRLHDQPAYCSLLHAGPQHYAPAWSRSIVRRLWNAGNRFNARLPARLDSRSGMERRPAAILFLVAQRWPYGDVCPQSAARWSDADLGFG